MLVERYKFCFVLENLLLVVAVYLEYSFKFMNFDFL